MGRNSGLQYKTSWYHTMWTPNKVSPLHPMQKSIMKSRDRIGELPDAVLDSVLSLLALKYVIRTSVLSTRWRNLWKNTWSRATALDFGREFAKAHPTQEQCVTTIHRYLELHNGGKIKKFMLYLHSGDQYPDDVAKWIQFAHLRGVEELELIFCRETLPEIGEEERLSVPDVLFACETLIRLHLSHIEFRPSLEFTGLKSLETLKLNQVYITDDALESLLLNCPVLTDLCLRLCSKLGSIKISGGPNLQLRRLSLIDIDAAQIDINAPNLKSFHFYGNLLYGYTFQNVAALEDVFLSSDGYEHTEPEHDYTHILSSVSHIKVLTTCLGAPLDIYTTEEYNPEALPIDLPNLQELQILIGREMNEEYLGYVYCFFKHTICPCLEKLFVDFSGPYPWLQPNAEQAEEPLSCVFNNLKIVKVNHFRGNDTEMKMVKFFLDRAVVLETMVLVVAPAKSPTEKESSNIRDGDDTSHQYETIKRTPSTKLLLDQLVILPKASKDAQILLFDQCEVDTSLRPLHTHTDYYLNNICCT